MQCMRKPSIPILRAAERGHKALNPLSHIAAICAHVINPVSLCVAKEYASCHEQLRPSVLV